MQDLSFLERAHATRLLRVCLREGPMPKSILYQIMQGTPNVMQARIRELVDAGMLSEVMEDHTPYRKIISLTPKGRRVAEKLAEIDNILAEL